MDEASGGKSKKRRKGKKETREKERKAKREIGIPCRVGTSNASHKAGNRAIYGNRKNIIAASD